MKETTYKWLLIVIASLCMVFLIMAVWFAKSGYLFHTDAEQDNLTYYLDDSVEGIHCQEGFVPDAKTAARIGGPIVDNLCSKVSTDFGIVSVYYDKDNRVWKVTKAYGIFEPSAFVIIDQDTGRIIKAMYQEN